MGVIAVDILLKTAVEAAISDLRAHPWILDDVFSGLGGSDPLSNPDYGDRETARAKEWFLKNNIPVFMEYRTDLPTFPAIIIVDGGSREMIERTSTGDDGSTENFDPFKAEINPQYVYKPFTPKSYDPETGIVTFPAKIKTDLMVPGQFLTSQRTGKAYEIKEVVNAKSFRIAAEVADDFTGAFVAPPTLLWNLQREQTFMQHTFVLMAMAQSDSVYAIWLHAVLMYILLRYKEVYLEGRGFEVSTFSSGPLTRDERMNPENVYYKHVTLVGQCELNWIKYIAPKFQAVTGGLVIADGPATPPGYQKQVFQQGWEMESDLPHLPGDFEDDSGE